MVVYIYKLILLLTDNTLRLANERIEGLITKKASKQCSVFRGVQKFISGAVDPS